MINFTNFLTESLDVEKLKHLEHAEDHIIHGGHEGVKHAADTLTDVVSILEGKPRKTFGQQTRITTKYDGAPSIVFGVNPENGKFFVASKSAFNKNPKINYTDRDIEENHGHAPGLVSKLKAALQELPKIMPKSGGVFQGDLMYTKDDIVKNKNGSYSFTPNTITYTTEDPEQTRSADVANLGVVVHSRYTGKNLADAKVSFDVDQSAFKRNPDVHMINPEISGANISPIEKKKYEKEIQQALDIYSGMDHDIFNVVDGHDITMKTYINACVRDKSVPNAKGYLNFVKTKGQKEIEKVKSAEGKAKKKAAADAMVSHVKNHTEQFDKLFRMHKSIQQAKDTLVNALSNSVNTGLKTTIAGKETKPEGFVAIRGGRPTKLVDRAEFSAANFEGGAFQKASKEEQAVAEKPENPVVTSFGRMNPPTSGHGILVSKVQELAKEKKAKHVIALSRSQDPEKNPLSPDQKLKHAKRMFPGANIEVADEKAKTVIDHVKKLAQAGHDHLTMVVGSDRVEEIQKLLNQYNGKEYNFKKIDVVSAGARDPDAEGPEGMSATKMRGHAIRGKFSEFKKGLPQNLHPDHAKEMFQDVRKAMDIRIDANTSGISLARYAKRNDPIGVRARREMQRRELLKPLPKPKKMKLKEEMTTGDVRGLGFVSGDPMVDSEFQTTWTTLNQADADTRDQIMNQTKKSVHDDLHIAIDQKREAQKQNFVNSLINSYRMKS